MFTRSNHVGYFSEMLDGRINRRDLLRRTAILGVLAATGPSLLAACRQDGEDPGDEDVDADQDVEPDEDEDEPEEDQRDAAPDEDRYGGTLRVAVSTSIPTLDVQQLGSFVVRTVGHHFVETLMAYEEGYDIGPALASSWGFSDDGLLLTIDLRDDVEFHNGKMMIAEDVVASIERYMEFGSRSGVVANPIETLDAPDDHTVSITMSAVNSGFIATLAGPLVYLGIFPREHIEGKGVGELGREDLIGTGPYRLEEILTDQGVRLVRFDNYYATEGERSGYTGGKQAYFDEIEFVAVTEPGARVSGLLAGDYDQIEDIPIVDFNRLSENPDVIPAVGGPGDSWNFEFNNSGAEPLAVNLQFRQAVQAAVDMDEMAALLTGGNSEFYDMNPSLYRRSQDLWWTEVGAELWNQADLDRARELLEESGYDGEEVVIVIGEEDFYQTMSTALMSRLEQIGMNVSLERYDRAGWQARTQEEEGWHITQSGLTMRFTPYDYAATWDCGSDRRFFCDEDMEAAFADLTAAFDYETQKAASDEIQRIHQEKVVSIKMPDVFSLTGHRSDIHGYERWYLDRFWGVWRE
jgi:peptide/nickel transport system substrate-binding protein